MSAAFLDTGYLIALAMARDEHHAAAQTHWRGVLAGRPALVTTSYVFAEVVAFLNRRGHHAKALAIGDALLASREIECVAVDERLFEQGWQLLRQHADKRWSLTDCVSFVVMRERGLSVAYGFDEHFVQAGFELEPGA